MSSAQTAAESDARRGGARWKDRFVPDWTYHPLRPLAVAALGERRTYVLALRFLALLIRHASGRRWIPWVFDHPAPVPEWSGRFGASVPPSVASDAITVLPVQG